MSSNLIIIMLVVCAAIVSILVLISIIVYKKKNTTRNKSDDWLFNGIHEIIYDFSYKKPPEKKRCGINIEEYEGICNLLHIKPDLKTLVAKRIEGLFILFCCIIIGILVIDYIIAAICFMVLGCLAFYLLCVMPYFSLKTQAENKIFKIKEDLPRFLTLVEKALDLPIDQAIMITAKLFKSPLSDDFIECSNRVSLGGSSWQDALLEMAKSYHIDVFSDLVLDITNSYNQGLDIRVLVQRKIYEMEQNRIYAAEEHDAKIKSMIFLPIIFFKVIPIMVLVCLPMVIDFIK